MQTFRRLTINIVQINNIKSKIHAIYLGNFVLTANELKTAWILKKLATVEKKWSLNLPDLAL